MSKKLTGSLKLWFKNQKIRNKIVVIYIPLIIIPLFVLGYVSSSIASKVIVKKTVKNVMDNSGLIITRIDGMLINEGSYANMLTLNLNKIYHENHSYDLQLSNAINTELSLAKIVFPDVESAAFIDIDNRLFCTNVNMQNGFNKALQSAMFKEIDKSNGVNLWFPMSTRDFLVDDKNKPVLTIGKKVINTVTGDKLGIIIVNIKESSFSAIYSDMGPTGSGEYFITDSKGTIISSANKEEILKPVKDEGLKKLLSADSQFSELMDINGSSMLVTGAAFPDQGWKLVNVAPMKELVKDTNYITEVIILMGIICWILAVIGAGVLSKLIANPIINLKENMLAIRRGNLEVTFETTSGDEIGELSSGFNTMISRIKSLLEKINIEQKKKREYELALFHAQIKPHFLYNTLDVIYTLSEMGRIKDVQKTTKSLADYYRIALSKGKECISIREEIKNVRDYLSIQRIRYSDVFDFEIDVDEEIMEYDILKLTVQPLVENAIYHGLKIKPSFGSLKIKGYKEDGFIFIKVIDDGAGIPEEKLKNLLGRNPDKGEINSFGVNNVDERIKLHFGEEYGLTIFSEVNKGTEAVIKLPAV